jgi:hypothetical protein
VNKEHGARAIAIAHDAFGLDKLGAAQAAGTAG